MPEIKKHPSGAPMLQRNTTPDTLCKYAIVRLDKLRENPALYKQFIEAAQNKGNMDVADLSNYIELGAIGSPEESFTLKLKDMFAPPALNAYAKQWRAAGHDDFADEIDELASRARDMPNRKKPD